MTKKRIILLAAVGLVFLGCLAWPARGPKEPVYQGKRLSQWLDDFGPRAGSLSATSSQAVRDLGTNAIPWLLREASVQDSVLKKILIKLLGWQSRWKFHIVTDSDRQARANRGFMALGPAGGLAVSQGLTNSDKWIRFGCVGQWEVGKLYPDLYAAPLIDRLTDPEAMVRARAANALGMVAQLPEKAVPALVIALDDPDHWVRSMAALGLSCYGNRASNAVPALLQHLSNSSSEFEFFATNALKAINPAALPKPGAK